MNSKNFDLSSDIYYSDEYVSLYIKENETLFSFEYQENRNLFIHKSIKRPILKIGDLKISEDFYDLETAYGYGGFYTKSDDNSFIARAMKEYEEKCKNENIIAEFIRFHPCNTFPILHENYLDFNIYDRDVVIKDLSVDIISSYSSKVRNTIKRANEKVKIQESQDIDTFMDLYATTMEKNHAEDFYFFNKAYYMQLLANDSIKLYEIIYNDTIVAMGFFMFSDKIAHYHLSANSEASYKLNANYTLLNSLFTIAQKEDIEYFILGGGATPDKEDTLFRFKKKFSKELKPFYISGKIYNNEVYKRYTSLWEAQNKEEIRYFLKYRLENK